MLLIDAETLLEAVREVIEKQSLTDEQRATYIAALVLDENEVLELDNDTCDANVVQALLDGDLSALASIG